VSACRRITEQKARACGKHAIVATQKPSAEDISTTTRSNLGAQLALRVRSAIDGRVITGTPGAESLAGNGDAVAPSVTSYVQVGEPHWFLAAVSPCRDAIGLVNQAPVNQIP
jgi:DNA segregation ATPase FtsK/SpoIIIE-like protein